MEENNFLNKKQVLKIDYFILGILKDLLLNKNFSFIDIRNFIDDSVLEELNCIKSDIEMRVMYNFWMWFLDLFEVDEKDFTKIFEKCSEKNIDPEIFFEEKNKKRIFKKELFYSYFLEIKITADWLKRIEELEKEIGDSGLINIIFDYFKSSLEFMNKIKYIAWISLTLLLILAIFVFDIKVSEYIKNIPLLSSIINTEILESFEKINENDEFYKEIKKKLKLERVVNIDRKDQWSGLMDFWFLWFENNNSPAQVINSSKSWLNINDIKVKNISQNEKIFRIILQNWEQRFIKVTKGGDWKFRLDLPWDLLNYRR